MRWRVFSLTSPYPLSARETVVIETPAAFATSWMVCIDAIYHLPENSLLSASETFRELLKYTSETFRMSTVTAAKCCVLCCFSPDDHIVAMGGPAPGSL